MKEEVFISHSKLILESVNYDLKIQNSFKQELEPHKQIVYSILGKSKTSKFNLSKLSDVEKLKWLLNANDIIDYDLTYPIIEKLHEMNFLKPLIDAEINGSELSVSIESLESSLGIPFNDHNYTYYLHFNTANKPLKMPVLVQTKDLIKNIINKSYTEYDFFLSVPFINSLIYSTKSLKVKFYFVIINLPDGQQTIGIKVEFDSSLVKYYDSVGNPSPKPSPKPTPKGNGGTLLNVNPVSY